MKASEAPSAPANDGGPRRTRILAGAVAVVLVVALLIASLGLGLFQPLTGGGVGQTSSATSPTMGEQTSPPKFCTDFSPEQELTDQRVMSGASASFPGYDEQLWLGLEQNFSSLSYNVTVIAQNDSQGFGPAYLLNGLTPAGFWYQVGIAWDIATGAGAYEPGFTFVYEVWNTNTSTPVYPSRTGTLPEGFSAANGDEVELGLQFSSGRVSMTARDLNGSASASASYGAFGQSEFVGLKDQTSGFATSLLTEWYHTLPYFCSGEGAAFSNSVVNTTSAWMRIDEWNLTGTSSSQRFNSTAPGQCCVFNSGYQSVSFSDPAAFQWLTTNGTTIYANAHEFATP